MLRQLFTTLLKSEMTELRRRSAGGVLLLCAIALLGLAVLFALLALYLWLSMQMLAWQAALVVFCVLILSAAVFWISGRSIMRRRKKRRDELDQSIHALLGTHGENGDSNAPLGIIAAAALVGLIIGRTAGK